MEDFLNSLMFPQWSGPQWSVLEADIIGALAALTPRRSFEIEGYRGQLTFLPFESEPSPKPEIIVGLACGSRTALLGMSSWFLINLHPAARGLDPERLPIDLRLALLDSLVQPILKELSVVLGDEIFIREAPAIEWPTSGRVPRFELEFVGPEDRALETLAVALVSSEDQRWLQTRLAGKTRSRSLDLGFLSLPARVVLGGVSLPYSEIANFGPGDLLIADDPPILAGQALLEYPGLSSVTLELSSSGAVVTSTINTKETPVDNQTTANQITLPGDLELPLRFEIGRRMMTLSQIEALAAGVVLPVGNYPNEPVVVTCHGQRLARGILVDLGDGRLGVQLTEVGRVNEIPSESVSGDQRASAGETDFV
jgi:type III secretion protein Q